jgi:hypothetical protein
MVGDQGASTEPLTDVRDISRIAYGFMASKALFAALNLKPNRPLGPTRVRQRLDAGLDPPHHQDRDVRETGLTRAEGKPEA